MLRTPRIATGALAVLALLAGLTGCADDAVETIQQGESAACAADQTTIEVAVDTFYANGGASGGATMDALVSAGLLRAASTSFLVGPDGITVVPIPGGLCDTGTAAAAATTVPSGGLTLTPEQCESDRATLQAAVDAFGAAYSVSPMDEAELVKAGLLVGLVAGYDLQGSTVVPAVGVCA